jgi:hypothetical protein
MDGDPIVRQIVNKLYGPGDEVLESVVIKESEVIVSRETLRRLFEVYEDEVVLFFATDETKAEHNAFIDEVRTVLGDA